MTENIYTQDQMDIALIKNTQEGMFRVITTLESDIKNQICDFKSEVKSELKSQFNTLLTLILGIYGIMGAAAVGKVFGVI